MSSNHDRLLFNNQSIYWWNEQEKLSYTQELHDTVLQEQIVLARAMGQLKQDSVDMKNDEIAQRLEQLMEQQQDIVHMIRQYCSTLRLPALLGITLEEGIKRLVDHVHLHSNIEVISEIAKGVGLTANIELHIYRIIQELLNNAIKHSQASEIILQLWEKDDEICVAYWDNGIGMIVADNIYMEQENHMGISGMYYRIAALGGQIIFESEIGQGLSVTINVPY